jgi:hypothetical protein
MTAAAIVTAVAHPPGITIPLELRDRPQWVAWDAEKKPHWAVGKLASSTDSSTWLTHAEAAALMAHGFKGVGYVFATDDPFCGIDFDKCRRPDGSWDPDVIADVAALDSYTEISQSGRGLHVIVRASLDGLQGNRRGPVELYDRARYFALTGDVLDGRDVINERQAAVNDLHARRIATVVTVATSPTSGSMDLRPVLERFEREHPRRFHKLMIAGKANEYEDDSKLDDELARIVATYTRDQAVIRAAMEESPLKRAKWVNHRTYLSRTIDHALRVTVLASDPEATKAVEPLRARTLREVWADPDAHTSPEAVIPRLAWRGRLTVYTALDKGGKSTLMAAGVGAMTRGDNFLGEPTVQGSCLWSMLEEHVNDWAIRAKRFGTDEDAIQVLEHPSDPVTAIRTECERLRPTVLVVDVLTRYAGDKVTESGSAAQWTTVMVGLQEIARQLDVAVVCLHHSRKSDGAARDSSEITARADVVLEQKTLPEDGVQRFTVRGRWTVTDFAVKLTGDRHELTAGGMAEGLSPQRRKVLDALIDGMRFTEWQKASAAAGVPRNTFAPGVRWLSEHEHVEADGETYRRPRF